MGYILRPVCGWLSSFCFLRSQVDTFPDSSAWFGISVVLGKDPHSLSEMSLAIYPICNSILHMVVTWLSKRVPFFCKYYRMRFSIALIWLYVLLNILPMNTTSIVSCAVFLCLCLLFVLLWRKVHSILRSNSKFGCSLSLINLFTYSSSEHAIQLRVNFMHEISAHIKSKSKSINSLVNSTKDLLGSFNVYMIWWL